jgi:hypothetical protein
MDFNSSRQWSAFVMASVILLTCGSPLIGAESKPGQVSLNDGYSLFYDFCKQESQLSLLLWIKTTPPDISDYAKLIASTAREDMTILEKMGVADSSLELNKVSLPPFELDVRSSMAEDRKQQLIWGSSGTAFAKALVMTQSETTNYGLHVAKVLAEMEPDSHRALAMHRMYDKWLELHNEAYRLR